MAPHLKARASSIVLVFGVAAAGCERRGSASARTSAIEAPPPVDARRCPPEMVAVPAGPSFCVDRWEAHLVAIGDDGAEEAWSPYANPGTRRVRAKSAPRVPPQGYVSRTQAESACKAAGKRLCSDDEWLAACRGAARTAFPYGDDERPGTCNGHRDRHPAVDLGVASGVGDLTDPRLNQVPGSLAPAGSNPGCVTHEGAFDMVGNLHEWTADPEGTFRGGYYMDTRRNGVGCAYVTTAHDSTYWDYSTGFRCCAEETGSAPRAGGR